MKTCFLFLALLTGFLNFAQTYSVPPVDYPFFDAVEWKGNGLMMLSRDPSGLKKKITLTYLSDKNYSVWQESFNPSSKEYYYISGENARYVYFLDALEPTEGKLSFHQISSAGNIKSSVAQIGSAIKKLGNYDITQLKMVDIFTTDKALLFILRYQDKKEKKYTDFLVSMTHHNMVLYAGLIGEITEAQLKDPRYSFWNFSGFEGDNIYFSTRDVSDKKAGWSVQTISSKATSVETRFIEGPGFSFDAVTMGSSGMTGSYYMNSTEVRNGQLLYMNNNFYLSGVRTDAGNRKFELYQLKEAKWNRINSSTMPAESSKKPNTLSCLALNEGVVYRNGSQTYFLSFKGENENVSGTANEFSPNNPSRATIKSPKTGIAVSLPTGMLLFDPVQLNKAGNINLEFIKK
jgi:hypothetical protein